MATGDFPYQARQQAYDAALAQSQWVNTNNQANSGGQMSGGLGVGLGSGVSAILGLGGTGTQTVTTAGVVPVGTAAASGMYTTYLGGSNGGTISYTGYQQGGVQQALSPKEWFFNILRQIEQGSVARHHLRSRHFASNDINTNTWIKSEWSGSKYDDAALSVQGYRNFNEKEVSLVGMVSFILCNGMKPKLIVEAMEDYGIVFV